MQNVVIYHNPRCTKSRQTLELLQSKGIQPKVVEYLKNPPSFEELSAILDKLNMMPVELMRTGEKTYHELGLAAASYTPDGLIEIMVENPILIERPIVVAGNKAAIGRPPENILEILP